jgi:predicted dehydrogenase
MKQLRVGIAGYGIVGRRRKQCIDGNDRLKLIGVCDRVLEDGQDQSGEFKYYKNYKDLIKEDLDILLVCMTNDVAAEVTMAALDMGLHVFCEKPPGRNVEEIERVIECLSKYPNLKLMYGFNHRYHYSVIDALSMIKSRQLGGILNMRGAYGKSKLITFNQSAWRTNREIAGGGVLLDQGIHMVDLMRLFAGEFSEVYSFISNSHWKLDVEDNAYALMKTDSGIIGMLHSSATQWRHRFHLDINLEYGSLILGGFLSGTKSYGAETLKVVWADPDNDQGDPREQITLYNKDDSWTAEIDKFVECIVYDKTVEGGSVLDVYKTMQLVYKIYYADPVWRNRYLIPDPSRA